MIESRARHKGLRNFRVVRVFLGDLGVVVRSGGGNRFSLRERLKERREADVMVDARAYLIHNILKWCKKVASKDPVIVVETSSQDCFHTLQKLLGDFHYKVRDNCPTSCFRHYCTMILICWHIQVVDAFDPEFHVQAATLPRLVYHETTMQTVNAVLALVEAKVVDPAKCCAVFQEAHGIDGLLGLQSLTEHRFNIICTAVLYVGRHDLKDACGGRGQPYSRKKTCLDGRKFFGWKEIVRQKSFTTADTTTSCG
jgi:hypothetical protein